MIRFSMPWRRIASTAAVLVPSMLLGGCFAAIRDQAQVDPAVAAQKPLGGHGQARAILPNCTVKQWAERAAGTEGGATECANSGDEAKTVTLQPYDLGGSRMPRLFRRTQAQAELMTYADQICDDHVAGIYAKNAGTNFNLGFLTTLFSGGAAIASGRAATNFAAESALFSGTRSLVNSEVYYGYIGPAVMREIRSLRSDLRTQISAKRNCSIDDYPPQEAIDDALIYHDACSFSAGLASLLSKAGNTRVGEDKLRTAQLKAMASSLSSKKAELKKAQAELSALAGADSAQAGMLKDQIAQLNRDITRIEGVLSFAGVVDPDGTIDKAADPDTAVKQASEKVEEKKQAVAVVPDTEKPEAQAALNAAATELTLARASRETSVALSQHLIELQGEIKDLTVKKTQIASQSVKGAVAPNAAEAQIKAVDRQIETKRKEVETTSAQKAATVPDTADRGIEFGIQQCAPVRLPTAQ